MGKLLILEPAAAINLITNPSVELNLTNWNGVSSAGGRGTAQARFGHASYGLTTSQLVINEGVRYDHAYATTDQILTASTYVRGQGNVRIRMVDSGNGLSFIGKPIRLSSEYWMRIHVSGMTGGGNPTTIQIFVETAETQFPQGVTFFVDALQLEETGYLTTYIDGDQELEVPPHDGEPWFKWMQTKHAGPSSRSGRFRGGGRWKDLSQGLDTQLWFTNVAGLGMPSQNLLQQVFSTQEKALIQASRPMPKTLTIGFFASKDPATQVCTPASLKELHKAREALEELIKPDLVQETQAMIIRYLNGGAPIDLEAFYETGLEFTGDFRFPWANGFPTRFLCPDPFWRADSQDICELESENIKAHNGLMARINGQWTGFTTGGTGAVRCIVVHPISGDIYVGGDFTQMDGDITCKRICRILADGSAVFPLDEGVDDGGVRTITFGPDGTVYVGGSFLAIDAVAHNRIASYNPSTDAWSTMGPDPGLDAAVSGIAVASDQDTIYIGGEFTESFTPTVTPLNKICQYSIAANNFSNMTGGSGNGVNGTVDEVIMDKDGTTVFLCGAFTQETGAAADSLKRVAIWNGSTFANMGEEGAEARVRYLTLAPNGNVYAAGDFDNIGKTDADLVAVWNRTAWFPLGKAGDGLTGTFGTWVDVDEKGVVLYGGDFTEATGVRSGSIKGIATWNGTRFSFLDIYLDTFADVKATVWNGEDIWIGGDFSGNAEIATIHTCTNNGKARNGPVLEVKGEMDLMWLENQTTGQIVRMQFEIAPGETLLLDLRRGMRRAISDWRGNLIGDLLPDSDELDLLPGENEIAFFARNWDGESVLRWRTSQWSFDD